MLHRIVLFCLFACIPALAQSGKNDLRKLAWISGVWSLQSANTVVEEHWTGADGGRMVGMGRTIESGKVVSFEFLRIEQRGDEIFYIAQPGGNPPTEFRMVSAGNDEAVFENLQHDFPQRIRYRRTSTGMTARVEDAAGKQHEEFAYSRAACR